MSKRGLFFRVILAVLYSQIIGQQSGDLFAMPGAIPVDVPERIVEGIAAVVKNPATLATGAAFVSTAISNLEAEILKPSEVGKNPSIDDITVHSGGSVSQTLKIECPQQLKEDQIGLVNSGIPALAKNVALTQQTTEVPKKSVVEVAKPSVALSEELVESKAQPKADVKVVDPKVMDGATEDSLEKEKNFSKQFADNVKKQEQEEKNRETARDRANFDAHNDWAQSKRGDEIREVNHARAEVKAHLENIVTLSNALMSQPEKVGQILYEFKQQVSEKVYDETLEGVHNTLMVNYLCDIKYVDGKEIPNPDFKKTSPERYKEIVGVTNNLTQEHNSLHSSKYKSVSQAYKDSEQKRQAEGQKQSEAEKSATAAAPGGMDPKDPKKESKRSKKEKKRERDSTKEDLVRLKDPDTSIKKTIQEKINHIFSKDHVAKDILRFGPLANTAENESANKEAICKTLEEFIKKVDGQGVLRAGLNQFKVFINGLEAEIRVYIQDGTPSSINLFPGHPDRIIGNSISISRDGVMTVVRGFAPFAAASPNILKKNQKECLDAQKPIVDNKDAQIARDQKTVNNQSAKPSNTKEPTAQAEKQVALVQQSAGTKPQPRNEVQVKSNKQENNEAAVREEIARKAEILQVPKEELIGLYNDIQSLPEDARKNFFKNFEREGFRLDGLEEVRCDVEVKTSLASLAEHPDDMIQAAVAIINKGQNMTEEDLAELSEAYEQLPPEEQGKFLTKIGETFVNVLDDFCKKKEGLDDGAKVFKEESSSESSSKQYLVIAGVAVAVCVVVYVGYKLYKYMKKRKSKKGLQQEQALAVTQKDADLANIQSKWDTINQRMPTADNAQLALTAKNQLIEEGKRFEREYIEAAFNRDSLHREDELRILNNQEPENQEAIQRYAQLANTAQENINRIMKTLEGNGLIIDITCTVKSSIADPSDFETFSGTSAQCSIHRNLVNHINSVEPYYQEWVRHCTAANESCHVEFLTQTIWFFASMARFCNGENGLEVAASIEALCACLVRVVASLCNDFHSKEHTWINWQELTARNIIGLTVYEKFFAERMVCCLKKASLDNLSKAISDSALQFKKTIELLARINNIDLYGAMLSAAPVLTTELDAQGSPSAINSLGYLGDLMFGYLASMIHFQKGDAEVFLEASKSLFSTVMEFEQAIINFSGDLDPSHELIFAPITSIFKKALRMLLDDAKNHVLVAQQQVQDEAQRDVVQNVQEGDGNEPVVEAGFVGRNSVEQALMGKDVQALKNDYMQQMAELSDCERSMILQARLQAIEAFEQSNGKSLKIQLNDEFGQLGKALSGLEAKFPDNKYVRIIAPGIHGFMRYAASMIFPIRAFKIVDFCRDVIQLLERELCLLERSQNVYYDDLCKVGLDQAQLKMVAMQAFALSRRLSGSTGFDEWYDDAPIVSVQDMKFLQIMEPSLVQIDQEKEALYKAAVTFAREVHAMTWEALNKRGVEIGATMVLDLLALSFVNNFTLSNSIERINQVLELVPRGVEFDERYAFECAGFGKLVNALGGDAVHKRLAAGNEMLFGEHHGQTVAQIIHGLEGKR